MKTGHCADNKIPDFAYLRMFLDRIQKNINYNVTLSNFQRLLLIEA